MPIRLYPVGILTYLVADAPCRTGHIAQGAYCAGLEGETRDAAVPIDQSYLDVSRLQPRALSPVGRKALGGSRVGDSGHYDVLGLRTEQECLPDGRREQRILWAPGFLISGPFLHSAMIRRPPTDATTSPVPDRRRRRWRRQRAHRNWGVPTGTRPAGGRPRLRHSIIRQTHQRTCIR